MAPPAYTWEFVTNLLSDAVPTVVALEASSNLETKVGTLVVVASGQVDEAGNSAAAVLGLAMEDTAAALTAGTAIKVALLGPGMVIKGTADADATTLAGFNGKTVDTNADGSLDVADTTNGCMAVWRVENSGLTVYCVPTAFAFA